MHGQTFSLANDPRGSKQMQGDKDGLREEEGNMKKSSLNSKRAKLGSPGPGDCLVQQVICE